MVFGSTIYIYKSLAISENIKENADYNGLNVPTKVDKYVLTYCMSMSKSKA